MPKRFARVATVAALALLSSCATPLAPGFHTERQVLEVRYAAPARSGVEESPPRLEVRATFLLRNTGNAALAALGLTLPDAQLYARQNLRIRLDGREVVPRAAEDAQAGGIQIPFDPPWPEKKRLTLEIEYELAPPAPGRAEAAVSDASFHLRAPGWFPVLQRPEKLFARGGERAEEVRLRVRVPQDFRVVAAGRAERARTRSGETEHRFRLREGEFDPFIVAGRYHEQRIEDAAGTIIFWTLDPLAPGDVRRAAARLAASFKTFEGAFGPVDKDKRTPRAWIVETSARLGAAPAGNGFPQGALLNREAFTTGVASESFLALAEHELAHTWFGSLVAARPEAELVLNEAAADYAVVVAAEARGGEPARQRQAALLLRWYDEAKQHAEEKPLLALDARAPREQRALAYSKGALLFVALEDECGKESVRRALGRLAGTLRGERIGFAELRSAIELESGRNVAELFRTWLNQTGIPAGFRARYEVGRK